MKLVEIKSLFNIEYGNQLDLNKLSICSDSQQCVAFVSRTSKDNGVSAWVEPENSISPYPSGLITVTLGGTYLLSAFVQQQPFYTAQNIKVLSPKLDMSVEEKLIACSFIRHNRFRYTSHGREANKTFNELQIPSIEEIRNLSSHFALPRKPSIQAASKNQDPLSLYDRKWSYFRYEDVFTIKNGFYNKKPEADENGSIPFIGATEHDNGVTSWHNQETIESTSKTGKGKNHGITEKMFPGRKYITISNNGSTGHAFYQPQNFTCSHDVNPITTKNIEMNPYIAMFLSTLIEMERYRWDYGRKWRPIRMPKSIIKLPVDDSSKPDWNFMEYYIKSLPYSSNLE